MEEILFDFLAQYIELTAAEKSAIIELNAFKCYKKGTVLLQEGQVSDIGYFVLKGCIRSYYIIEGEEKTTEFYTELEGITPKCVLDKCPSKYYISCLEDTIVSISNVENQELFFEKFPRFETLCRVLTEEELSKRQVLHDEFKISSPEQRYKQLLENRPKLIQHVPQQYLASYLGITPQSLSRMKNRILANLRCQ